MKILIDENIPAIVKKTLKQQGYNVLHVNNLLKSKSDKEIFEYAQKKKMCIITKDVDFKNMIKEEHYGILKICGVMLNPSDLIIEIIKKYKEDFNNKYIEIYKKYYIEYIKKFTKKGKFKQFYKVKKAY